MFNELQIVETNKGTKFLLDGITSLNISIDANEKRVKIVYDIPVKQITDVKRV